MKGARYLVQRLVEHTSVEEVFYPGLSDLDPPGVLGGQFRGSGSIFSFRVAGGYPAAADVLARVELMTAAVSLGSVDTLIQHPAVLTHRIVDPKGRDAARISDDMLRVAVGLEEPQDLWQDLLQALRPAKRSQPPGRIASAERAV